MFPRLSSVALSLLLLAGNAAVCAGWADTPEARMACCAQAGNCPMHERGGAHSDGTAHESSQQQADACCAASERQQSNRSTPGSITVVSIAVLGPGVVVSMPAPPLVLSDGWRAAAPIPTPLVPRHVLLSVFLV